MCADRGDDATESEVYAMTSDEYFAFGAYIEITNDEPYPTPDGKWTYRLSMTMPTCRLICRNHPMLSGKKAKFVFDVDKSLAIGIFDHLARFQLKMSPPGHWRFDGGETNLTIGSSFGYIKMQLDDPGIENEALENYVCNMEDMASLLVTLQRNSPDMEIKAIRFCKINRTDICEEHANIEKTIGLRYAGCTVYALDSANREFGQFSPEDSAFILDNISIDRQLKICAGNWFGEADGPTMDALVLEYTPRCARRSRNGECRREHRESEKGCVREHRHSTERNRHK